MAKQILSIEIQMTTIILLYSENQNTLEFENNFKLKSTMTLIIPIKKTEQVCSVNGPILLIKWLRIY